MAEGKVRVAVTPQMICSGLIDGSGAETRGW